MRIAPYELQTVSIATSQMGMAELRRGIEDPLQVARFVNYAEATLNARGLQLCISNDLEAFAAAKVEARGTGPSPMFDVRYGDLADKAFWIGIRDEDNRVVGLNAYRLDFIDTTLADWIVGWMAGLYMKAGLLMVPESIQPTKTSKSHRLSGWLCYHGELWLEKATRGPRDVGEAMTLAGHMLALLKWHPAAMWALVDQRVGLRGIGILNGYPHAERSFLQWAWRPEDISANEWLLVAESHELQQAAEDRLKLGLISTPG